ncbi:MAG: type II secretion system protein [Actinomycetes bacterium]
MPTSPTHRRSQAGIALIPVLGALAVAIFIIGAVAMFGAALQARHSMDCSSNLAQVRSAAVRYYAAHGTYAADEETLVAEGLLSGISESIAYSSTPDGPPQFEASDPNCDSTAAS